MNQLRKSDPVLETLRAVMGEWNAAIGPESVTVAHVIREATEQDPVTGKLVRPDLSRRSGVKNRIHRLGTAQRR
jgi:hypothetical protein